MSTYLALRTTRILLWGAFVLSLALATSFKVSGPAIVADAVRYVPPALLLLALAIGLVERIVRKRNGLAAIRFGRA